MEKSTATPMQTDRPMVSYLEAQDEEHVHCDSPNCWCNRKFITLHGITTQKSSPWKPQNSHHYITFSLCWTLSTVWRLL